MLHAVNELKIGSYQSDVILENEENFPINNKHISPNNPLI